MNALTVWNVWRRILREDALGAAMFGADPGPRLLELGLSESECAIALSYARTKEPTRWAIETYRFRSFNVIVEALLVAAPLTARLLSRRDHDLDALARAYLTTVDWKDDGPYTYRTCAAMLVFLRGTLGESDSELAELIDFEAATVGLLRSLSTHAWESVPSLDEEEMGRLLARDARFVQSGRGVIWVSRFDLAPWLGEPDAIGVSKLEPKRVTFLRYLRSQEEDPALLSLKVRALSVYESLAEPRSVVEVAALLGETDPSHAAKVMRRFASLNVIRGIKD